MPNSPSKPSSANHESPKGSGFRTMIFLLLGAIAASGIGGYVLGKMSEGRRDKPDIIDTTSSGDKSFQKGILLNRCEHDLAKCRSVFYATLSKFYSECDQSGSSADCKNLSPEDINKLVINERLKAADRIIQDLCLSNKDDMRAIEEAAKKGCTEFDIQENLNEEFVTINRGEGLKKEWLWVAELKRPDDTDDRICESVVLMQAPPYECRLPEKKGEQKNKQEIEERERKGKKIVGLIWQKNYAEAMKGIDPKKIKDDARRLGLYDSEVMREFIDITERTQAVLSGDPDKKIRKLLACEMASSLMKLVGVLEDSKSLPTSVRKYLEHSDIFPFEEFVLFVENFAEAQGLDVGEECIMYMNDFRKSYKSDCDKK